MRLRSYAGRSLFSGLLSAPASRKRAGLVDILDSFPESKFFLIGDSGEQDLELYAEYIILDAIWAVHLLITSQQYCTRTP